FERFWLDPFGERVHLVGKDILRFHAVYWPAFLMSAGMPLPTAVEVHGWWLKDERKVSKSSSNVVRPTKLIEDLGNDALRFFLLRDMVFGQDAQYSDEACLERYNSDLANGLGNTVSRLVTLSRKAFDGKSPPEPCFDNPVLQVAEEVVEEYRRAVGELAFHRALQALWRLHAEASQYLVSRQPWKRLGDPDEKAEVSRILWNCLEAVRLMAVGLLPFLPESAPRVLAAIGIDEVPRSFEALEWGGMPNSRLLDEPPVLFPRVDKEEFFSSEELGETTQREGADEPSETAPEESEMIDIEEFARTDLRIGTVTAAVPVPKADKLLQLTVDVGGEERTLVAGISQHYEPDEVVGRQVVVVANLKPATIMGVESQGMVLAASVDGRPVLLAPIDEVPNGTKVR
ncbi:MAG: methionine--tRNA ligase subunit beta, partial [Thermoanaerobaculia bacterium]|nr:methionine--tRNA ligase subunit beta [Thermoanaerobaculia bacterium]